MLQLLSNPLSPYGRKVLLAAAVKGLRDEIEVLPVDTNPGDSIEINTSNPLGKIPVLRAEGMEIFDSHVICEYLDGLAPAPLLFPKPGPERWDALIRAALADGILEAALLLVYEKRFRPEDKWHAPWQQRQQAKIDRALARFEARPPAAHGPDYGDVTLACALGYLDFRHEGRWRAEHPRLVAWLDTFAAATPAFAVTRPVPPP